MKNFLQGNYLAKIVAISSLLIAVSVFYKFIVEPVYNKYQLSSCLSSIEKHIETVKVAKCAESKQGLLNDCLWTAQDSLYCKDAPKPQPAKTGFWEPVLFLESVYYNACKAPNNSAGYWNDNAEYQMLAQKCEQSDAGMTCKTALNGSLDAAEAEYRDKEQAFCFKRY